MMKKINIDMDFALGFAFGCLAMIIIEVVIFLLIFN